MLPVPVQDVEAPPDNYDCRACGACCATDASWPRFSLETEADIARIPPELVDEPRGRMRSVANRCVALLGDVGAGCSCAIYEIRPLVCRDCAPGDPECLMARARHGV